MGTPITPDTIRLRGARVHNLKGVDVDLPRGALIVICGVSGSGKTSLAIDTLYAEGQRRYIESFSAYTRQFLQRLDKPEYDSLEGLPPSLAVTRGAAPRGNRSTVGTASDTLDYLRLLFAKVARPFCYQCGQAVLSHSPQSVAQTIAKLPQGSKLMIGFAVEWDDPADRASVLSDLQAAGFVRLLSRDSLLNLGQDAREQLADALPAKGEVIAIVDRVRGGDSATRTTESLEVAFDQGNGDVFLLADSQDSALIEELRNLPESASQHRATEPNWWPIQLSRQLRCVACNIEYPAAEPRLFSFNSPLGACPVCEGFGDTIDLDLDLIVPDPRKTIRDGAIAPWNTPAHSHNLDELLDLTDALPIPVDTPFYQLTAKQKKQFVEGVARVGFRGLKGFFAALERKKYKMHVRVFLSRWRSYNRCNACGGARLNPLALSYRIAGYTFSQFCELQVTQLSELLAGLQFDAMERKIASGPLEQVTNRLSYLTSVGLEYLTLDRTLRTLSGGEAQRTALTAALGSSLVNMLYVLDEPSVGLHPHDVERLSVAIDRLVDRGNTVLMIEHEEALIERADWVIEVGPAAGEQGGEVVFAGTRAQLLDSSALTGQYLSDRRQVPIPAQRRASRAGSLSIKGCSGNNLRNIDVDIPLGMLCLVTGVSGSGKSSLVNDTLYGALINRLTPQREKTLPFESISGTSYLDDCILIDQSPISRSPRSNPVTYIKAFDEIRKVFAETIDARTHNYEPGHFSFNSELGRCPACSGDGLLQIDMQFLADVFMTCPDCHGDRYRSEILSVRYRDRNISDVLHMTVHEARNFFRGAAKVQAKLKVLEDVGLGYLQLGQAATTLSSGEAQRLKLAAYLASASRKRTLFILDEPTTGLHTNDIVQLLDCFDALIAAGHSLLVVEHNLHLMVAADFIIDLGPGAADQGGRIVAIGTPEEVAADSQSLTGQYLHRLFEQRRSVRPTEANQRS